MKLGFRETPRKKISSPSMKRSASENAIAPPKTYGRLFHLSNTILKEGYDDPTSRLSGPCENVLRYEIEPFLGVQINLDAIEFSRSERLKTPLNIKALDLIAIHSVPDNGAIYGHSKSVIYVTGNDNIIEEIPIGGPFIAGQTFGVFMLPNGNIVCTSMEEYGVRLRIYDRTTKKWSKIPVELPDYGGACEHVKVAVINDHRILVFGPVSPIYDIDLLTNAVIDHMMPNPNLDTPGIRLMPPDQTSDRTDMLSSILTFAHFNRCVSELILVHELKRENRCIALVVSIYNLSFRLQRITMHHIYKKLNKTFSVAADVASNVVCLLSSLCIVFMRNGDVHKYNCSFDAKVSTITIDSYGQILCLAERVIEVLH
jgi:hypothetical protein